MTNRHDVIKLLLENGADEKAEDDDGLTAYDQAKQEGHAEVLSLLSVTKGSGGGGGGGGGGGDGGGGGGCCTVS